MLPSEYATKYSDGLYHGLCIYNKWKDAINGNYEFSDDTRSAYIDIFMFTIDQNPGTHNLESDLSQFALKYGSLNLVRDLAQRNILLFTSLRDINYVIDGAAINGQYDVLQWLEEITIIPKNNNAANLSIKNGHLNILEWLDRRGFLPSQDWIDENIIDCPESNVIAILDWLETMDIFLTRRGIYMAVRNARIDILEWMYIRGVTPGQRCVDGIINNTHLESSTILQVLDWLEKRNIFPSSAGADRAVREYNFDILDWLEKRDIFPTRISADQSIENPKPETINMLNWLERKRILPTMEGILDAGI